MLPSHGRSHWFKSSIAQSPDNICRGFILQAGFSVLSNILWLALTNIRRKRVSTLLYFILAFVISQLLFLVFLSTTFLRLPEFNDIKRLFYTVTAAIMFLSVLVLGVLSYLFLHTRRRELGILRICGIRKSDMLMAVSLEIFIISLAGAICGIFCIVCIILLRVVYLPLFFNNLTHSKLLTLAGISGQTVLAVVILEITFSLILISLLLRNDINRLVRGSP